MKITRTNVDELNAVIKISIEKRDYETKVNNALEDYRKKAKVDGFRPGQVPMGIIKKIHRAGIMLEETNKIISENLFKFIYEEKMNVLGEPLASEIQSKEVDFENDETFEFSFDVALAPVFEVKMSKRDKINYYTIKVSEKMLDERITQYARMYGSNTIVDSVESNTEMIKGAMHQLDENGVVLEAGVVNENTAISLEFMKDEESVSKFKNAKLGDVIRFNPSIAYPNKADFASMLNITKEAALDVTSDFNFTIVEINRFAPSEISQELFAKVYPEAEIKDEAAFRFAVSEEISKHLLNDSDYKFAIDAKEKLVKKCNITLPESFLKRWILTSNKETTVEQIEKEFPLYADDIRWQIIKSKLIEEKDLRVDQSEMIEMAKQFARMQMQQYGIANLPDEQLESFAHKILESEQERRNIVEKASESKVMSFIKDSVKLEEKEVEVEEFNKFFE